MKKLIFTVAMLCCFPGWSFEPATDLKGSTAMAVGTCLDDGVPFQCFAVMKGDSKYMVMADGKGPAKVYQVEDFKQYYSVSDLKMVWQRIDA